MKQLLLILLALMIVGCAGAVEEAESDVISSQDQLDQETALTFVEATPTLAPTDVPTEAPTEIPTLVPTEIPTAMPVSGKTLNLSNTQWELVSMPSGRSLEGATVSLDFSDVGIQGNAGCNSFFGKYTLNPDGTMAIGSDIGSTDMWCEAMEIETEFLQTLSTVEKAAVVFDELILGTPSGDLVFVKPKPIVLEGTTWILGGMLNTERSGFVTTALDQEINLTLGDARIGGYTGCNQMMGSYTLNGDSIKFDPISITRRACPEEKGPREFEYVNAFPNVARYEIDRETLKFFSEDGTLIMQFFANN